jgi:acyl carrier protein
MATASVTSAQDVLQAVQSIVASILGVDPDEVIPEARFVEDLNIF